MGYSISESLKRNYGEEFEICWIYGSRAIDLENQNSDLDVLIFKESIKNSTKATCVIEGIQTSLNFFGIAETEDVLVQSNNGLYFPTRFLSPIKLIFDKSGKSDLIELSSFRAILRFLEPLIRGHGQISAEKILALVYLFKIKMNVCYLFYFASWFASNGFAKFWNKKILIVEELLKSSSLTINVERDYQHNVYLQLLSANFWKFSYSYRNNDEGHINELHTKQYPKIADLGCANIDYARDFLIQKSYPFQLIENVI